MSRLMCFAASASAAMSCASMMRTLMRYDWFERKLKTSSASRMVA